MRLTELKDTDNTLRDYQRKSKQDIYTAWESSPSVMFQMPTGTGKTRLFVSIIKDTQRLAHEDKQPRNVLVLAHRTELIEQIHDTLGEKYHLAHGIIKSGYDEKPQYHIQVASVQTIIRRLERWKGQSFDFIIIDEAHHALAKTYRTICAAFPRAKILVLCNT